MVLITKKTEAKNWKHYSVYRPSGVEIEPQQLDPFVGLFGACGNTRWRQDHFIPKLERSRERFQSIYPDKTDIGPLFYNPQVGEWDPSFAKIEAMHMANDRVLVFPVLQATEGFSGLAEAGYALLGGLLRGQEIGFMVEVSDDMPPSVARSRKLFNELANRIMMEYAVGARQDNLDDLADWAKVFAETSFYQKNAATHELRRRNFSNSRKDLTGRIGVFGTSSTPNSADRYPPARRRLMDILTQAGLRIGGQESVIHDSIKPDWDENEDAYIKEEGEIKANAGVILNVITADMPSQGALAESGLMATNAFLSGQAYGIFIEDYPGDPKDPANRTRILVREHIRQLNSKLPYPVVYVADSIEQLADFAVVHHRFGEDLQAPWKRELMNP